MCTQSAENEGVGEVQFSSFLQSLRMVALPPSIWEAEVGQSQVTH